MHALFSTQTLPGDGGLQPWPIEPERRLTKPPGDGTTILLDGSKQDKGAWPSKLQSTDCCAPPPGAGQLTGESPAAAPSSVKA